MTRLDFTTAISALRCTDPRFPWVQPTPEEDDIAAILEAIQDTHQPTADHADLRGRYGRCTDCRTPWPCAEWTRGEELSVLWLGRGSDRYATHALQALQRGRTA
jgi:hypothetical protein